MIRASASPALLLGAALLLAGCAASTDYPSLAVRPVERVQGSGAPAAGSADAIPTLPPASADLTTRLAGLVDVARQAHGRFTARQAATERAVAAAGAARSDGWTAAEVALSDLQTSRSGALTALAELDQLYVDERAAHPEQVSPAATAIGAARDQVESWVSSETAVISRLDARLR
ncbi:hypothetical protein HNO88_000682 [Novosphingobium chloroacetimidivorans]|uniref:Lipoprotein n=1 Tax=Novosphingobium chloroacetimidivorans TaxID=1428314 RepID=A0A7W7NVR7_9SPHN|nr:hypothetical protein [Novosphingobium chloroacetimidivorans]MBB4857375.1 hypothetical protein [Novosphingobium chloroacetimidivorans]